MMTDESRHLSSLVDKNLASSERLESPGRFAATRRSYGVWVLLTVVLGILGISWLAGGQFAVEKSLTQLVMPVGVLWLALTMLATLAWVCGESRFRWALSGCWLLLTVCGTAPLPEFCIRLMEANARGFRPWEDEPLDVLLVLGGGARSGPTRAEASVTGDRLVYAAQLYIQGQAKKLWATGTSSTGGADEKDPNLLATEIWGGLGIPADAIRTLPGRNTREEIQSIKQALHEDAGVRVGILTSAAHLPRALRLASAAGLTELIPVPANHRSNRHGSSVSSFIPSVDNLEKLAVCQHEWLGWLVGR